MSNVLVPTDFSTYTDLATSYGIELANILGTGLTLFHAHITDNKEELQEKLNKEAEAASAKVEQVNQVIKKGPVLVQLTQLLSEENFSGIVMVTREEDKLDLTLGSMTVEIANKVKLPVLIIPEDCQHGEISKLAVIADFLKPKKDIPALKYLQLLGEKAVKEMHWYKPELEKQDSKEDETLDALMKELSLDSPQSVPADNQGTILENIKQLQDKEQFDAFFLPASQTLFINMFPGNLGKKIAMMTGKPVFIHNV